MWEKNGCFHYMGYSFELAARDLSHAPSNRQDSTYHSLCYTSCGALAGMWNIPPWSTMRDWSNNPLHYQQMLYQWCNKKAVSQHYMTSSSKQQFININKWIFNSIILNILLHSCPRQVIFNSMCLNCLISVALIRYTVNINNFVYLLFCNFVFYEMER